MHYTRSHEWIFVKGTTGIVGITDFAQKELGDIVFVELPKIGAVLEAGREASVLESTKAAADIYSPVSGKVVRVNESLLLNPSLVNQGSESSGWLFELELENEKELEELMTIEEYKAAIS